MYGIILGIVILLIILVVFTGVCPSEWPGKICGAMSRLRQCKSCPVCNAPKAGSEYFTCSSPPNHGFPICNCIEGYRTNSCVGTFDCTNEDFHSGSDVAAHTMFGGYQYRSTLPG